MGCFSLAPLAVLTYPQGRCKTGCGDEIAIFSFFFYVYIDSGISLAISSRSKKKKNQPFTEYSASSQSKAGAAGTTCEGMTHEPQLVPSSGWRSVGSGAQSPQFETPSTELPPSPCSAFGSGSFLPAPAPTLAHFHTASHVAWSLTKLNFNYFFFFKTVESSSVQLAAVAWPLAAGTGAWGLFGGDEAQEKENQGLGWTSRRAQEQAPG